MKFSDFLKESQYKTSDDVLHAIDKIVSQKLNRMGYESNIDPDSNNATFKCRDNDEPTLYAMVDFTDDNNFEIMINGEHGQQQTKFTDIQSAARYIAGHIS